MDQAFGNTMHDATSVNARGPFRLEESGRSRDESFGAVVMGVALMTNGMTVAMQPGQ